MNEKQIIELIFRYCISIGLLDIKLIFLNEKNHLNGTGNGIEHKNQ